jgi:hypothetical protein
METNADYKLLLTCGNIHAWRLNQVHQKPHSNLRSQNAPGVTAYIHSSMLHNEIC